ncbi:MAG TPA: hypothetical protein VHN99_10715, partial [Deinococcales bacterium]|nr:hypothetical protein [Deinococcales bacterium]
MSDRASPAKPDRGDTLPALSVRQPFVELILRGVKDVENRSFKTNQRGLLLLHASATLEPLNWEDVGETDQDLDPANLAFGALVGAVNVVDCTRERRSSWHEDDAWGWYLGNPVRFAEPIPYKGAAGIFRVPKALVDAALARATTGLPGPALPVPERWVCATSLLPDGDDMAILDFGRPPSLPPAGSALRVIARQAGQLATGSATLRKVETFDLTPPARPFLRLCDRL